MESLFQFAGWTVVVVIGVIVIIVLWAISVYNRLVKFANMVKEGWSGIDVQLKRRSNLIPNLLETVKGYMGHEQEVLENVIKARSQSVAADGAAQHGPAEGFLSAALGRLFAVAEAYPDLKADESFQKLHDALDEIEDQIQMARRYYNGTVRNLNILIESFPSNLIAGAFRFTQAEFFEIEEDGDRAVPDVSFGDRS